MKNNDKIKKLIKNIGVDGVLQCVIESIDDSTLIDNIVPSWKLKVLEHLEQAYDIYMTKDIDTKYANIRN
jgi:methyl coenzyme M reductase beta subunit